MPRSSRRTLFVRPSAVLSITSVQKWCKLSHMTILLTYGASGYLPTNWSSETYLSKAKITMTPSIRLSTYRKKIRRLLICKHVYFILLVCSALWSTGVIRSSWFHNKNTREGAVEENVDLWMSIASLHLRWRHEETAERTEKCRRHCWS